eukprot:g2163.t1
MATSSTDLPSEVQWPSFVALQELSQLRKVCRSNHQTCDQLLRQRYREIQATFVAIAHRAGDVLDRLPEELLEEDEEEAQASEQLWDLMSWVREKAKGLLELLEVTRDKCPDTEVVNGDVPHQILAEIVARAELEARGGTRNARTSHGGTRNARTSHGGTRNARTSHVEAAWTITEDTGGAWPEDLALPESMPGGTDLAKLQELEHQLLEARARQPGDSQELALILARLGQVKMNLGHQAEAIEHLNESLQLQRSLRPGDSMEVALILTRLGQMNRLQGHDAEAIEQLKESLRMQQSLHGDCDHEGIADTLHQLGVVTAHTGDLKEALWYMKESLRIERSLHGDIQHPGIADALHELGNVTAQTGDLKEALRYLKESLRMKQSIHGDGDHPGIAFTLHALGNVTAQTGDPKEALQYLKESLRMKQSLHGDEDHRGIAVTLQELGNVTAQNGDLKEALRYLKESLRMKQSLHGDIDHPDIALTLHMLGDVTAQTGDWKEALQSPGGGAWARRRHLPVSTMRASLAAGVRWALGRPREAEEAPEARKEAGVASAVRKPERVSTGQELAGKAWCRSCERSDFGRFCPQCGQHLVHEVVTPSGHYRLTAEVEEGTVSPPKAKSTLPFQRQPWCGAAG